MNIENFIKDSLPNGKNIEETIKIVLNGTVLFGTLICDTYKFENRRQIYKALDIVCNRKGYFAFDHYGIYFFWNYYTKEILYIGISKNLRNRFAQHNGLVKASNKGNKFVHIKEYFTNNEVLGYSVLVQSPYEYKDSFLSDKDDEIREIEGALIQDYFNKHNELPKWNDIGGAVYARKPYSVNRYGSILNMVNASQIGYMNSKSTLRELSTDEVKLEYESDLNPIRARMYKYQETFDEALNKLIEFNNFWIELGFFSAKYSNYRFEMLVKSDYYKFKKLSL